MRVVQPRDPMPFRREEGNQTYSLVEWQTAVNRRNKIYAAALVEAMEEGKSPDEARGIARRAYLASFDDNPEVEYVASLTGMEVAPVSRRGRRAA